MTYAQLFLSLLIFGFLAAFFLGVFRVWFNEDARMIQLQQTMKARTEALSRLDQVFIALFAFFSLVAVFYLLPVGFDFHKIYQALGAVLAGKNPYEQGLGVFYAPPVLVMLAPLALLPEKLAFALINTLSLLLIVASARKFNLSLPHIVLIIVSPVTVYNLKQGQVDPLFLGVLFLPRSLWLIASIFKPQATIGYAFALIRKPQFWLSSLLIFVPVFLLSLWIFPNWIALVASDASEQFRGFVPWSFFNIWPQNLLIFAGIILLAIDSEDDRLFLSASPFFLKYATIGSYIGLLISLFSILKAWQAAIVVFVSWFVLFLG